MRENLGSDSPPTKVRKVTVDDDRAGQRIDNFLRTQLPGVPKGRLYRLLRRGEVRVNGGRVRPNTNCRQATRCAFLRCA